jgi:hypothetical protein
MSKNLSMDVERLIADCGGPNLVRLRTGIKRTAIYSIFRRGKMTTDQLAAILTEFPLINARDYVVEK